MSFHSFDARVFEKWKQEYERVCQRPEWNAHDHAIHNAVSAFALLNQGKSGYIGPTWQLIKAIMWVETGAYAIPWKTQPMQIGWLDDPGIIDVLTNPRVSLVTPPELKRNFSSVTIKHDPGVNIQAGLALLHLKMASFGHRPKPSIAKEIGPVNPQCFPHSALRPRTSTEQYVTAWAPFCSVTVYQRYNIGDGAYAAKVDFAMQLVSQGVNG